MEEALAHAFEVAGPTDLVCVTGSLHAAFQAAAIVRQRIAAVEAGNGGVQGTT
jgi:hypothetical protein